MNDFLIRGRNALLGLAAGDAIGWPAMFHRSWSLPSWTRRLRRDIDVQREGTGVLRVPMPFSLNQPSRTFALSPTDDTEWATWTMRRMIRNSCSLDSERWVKEWMEFARGCAEPRGWVSTVVAMENLRNGLMPPASGHDNPHYFDDGAMCRAVPIGIAHCGRPELAAEAAGIDASVTNSEDGVWVAQAVAVAVSLACAGENTTATILSTINILPRDSWARQSVEYALRASAECSSPADLVPALDDVLNREYSDGSVGPETLALALAVVSAMGNRFYEAITTAAAFAKGADAVPAIVGAILGADSGTPVLSPRWERSLGHLQGLCFPEFAGEDYLHLVDEFLHTCPCAAEEHR